jgi:hypothetical protein
VPQCKADHKEVILRSQEYLHCWQQVSGRGRLMIFTSRPAGFVFVVKALEGELHALDKGPEPQVEAQMPKHWGTFRKTGHKGGFW